MFNKKLIKTLEQRIIKLEEDQTVKSFSYGEVNLYKLMRIVEKMEGKLERLKKSNNDLTESRVNKASDIKIDVSITEESYAIITERLNRLKELLQEVISLISSIPAIEVSIKSAPRP